MERHPADAATGLLSMLQTGGDWVLHRESHEGRVTTLAELSWSALADGEDCSQFRSPKAGMEQFRNRAAVKLSVVVPEC